MPRTQFPRVIPLSSLNGQNGFFINGEQAGDYSGHYLDGGKDFNGDGYMDIVVSAIQYATNVNTQIYGPGKAYVIFGEPDIGSSGMLNLSILNGTNGFMLTGEVSGDGVGWVITMVDDINGDDQVDLLISSNHHRNNTGRSYLVYGGPGVGSDGLVSLASLNGISGFKIDGEIVGDDSGVSMSGIGDFNADGFGDFLIAAESYNVGRGRSYIIFGGSNISSSGMLPLASLNGSNGYKIDGETIYSVSGSAVSRAGDVNYDGWPDIIIGAYGYNGLTGRSYVLFGNSSIGNSGRLLLSDLNSSNGFMINGETSGSWSGSSVGVIDDINCDGRSDLFIGAQGYNNNAGRNYILFGAPGIGNTGSISLSTLNGSNGFKIDGEVASDYSLIFLMSNTGDINGDGCGDVIIKASHNGYGRVYVLFGASNIGNSGIFSLSSINGSNGFMLDGEGGADLAGEATASAGDIDADGVSDILIGARRWNNTIGRTYVVFGDIAPIMTSAFVINQGQSLILSTQYLNGTDNRPVTFNITNVQHGRFEQLSAPGQEITLFTQSQVAAGQIQFVHDNSTFAPSISIQTPNTGIALTPAPQSANITFYRAPTWLNNQLTIGTLKTVQLDSSMLDVEDDRQDSAIIFNTTAQYGQFELIPSGNLTIQEFSRQQIRAGHIQFRHTDYRGAPSYLVSMRDGYFTLGSSACNVSYELVPYPPMIINNQITISQGDTFTLTDAELLVQDPDTSPENLIIFASNLQHVYFRSIPEARSVTRFSMGNISAGDIQIITDGSPIPLYYQITVSDGQTYVGPGSPLVIFNGVNPAPQLTSNNLNIIQGQSTIVTTNNLNSLDLNVAANQETFIISDIRNGQFERVAFPGIATLSFTLQEIQQNAIRFVSFDLQGPPSYSVSISNGVTAATTPSAAIINYTPINHPPLLVQNQLQIREGDTVAITSAELNATDPDGNSGGLIFIISDVRQGHFDSNGTTVSSFSQSDVSAGKIRFINSEDPPQYSVAVSDGSLVTVPQAARVNFTNVNKPPEIKNNVLIVTQGGSALMLPTQLSASDDETPESELLFLLSDIHGGQFEYVTALGTPITTFPQNMVERAQIRFVTDNSKLAPGYSVRVSDGELVSNSSAALVNFNLNPTVPSSGFSGPSLQSVLSTVGSVTIAAAGYALWRRRAARHRAGHELANFLRKLFNLHYHDFTQGDGELFKVKMTRFIDYIDFNKKGFYSSLTPEEKKAFALCVALEIHKRNVSAMQKRDAEHALLQRAKPFSGLFNWLLCFSAGWPDALRFEEFDRQSQSIADTAVDNWNKVVAAGKSPIERWDYKKRSFASKWGAYCARDNFCPPDRFAVSRDEIGERSTMSAAEDVEMAELPRALSGDISPAAADMGEGVYLAPPSAIYSTPSLPYRAAGELSPTTDVLSLAPPASYGPKFFDRGGSQDLQAIREQVGAQDQQLQTLGEKLMGLSRQQQEQGLQLQAIYQHLSPAAAPS